MVKPLQTPTLTTGLLRLECDGTSGLQSTEIGLCHSAVDAAPLSIHSFPH